MYGRMLSSPYGPMQQASATRGLHHMYGENEEMPDEFHHAEFVQRQFGRYEPPKDLDGYNDYGASRGSRADIPSSDCSGTQSIRHGARTAGYRPDLQRNGPQQWTLSEHGGGSGKEDTSSQGQGSGSELDRQHSGPRYGAATTKNGQRNSPPYVPKHEMIRRLPISSKSPTGHGSKQSVQRGPHPRVTTRSHANTAMLEPNGGLMDELSHRSYSGSKAYQNSNRHGQSPQDERLVADLKKKMLPTSQTSLQPMSHAKAEPVIEPQKAQEVRYVAHRMQSSASPINKTFEGREPRATNQYAKSNHKTYTVRESPKRQSDLLPQVQQEFVNKQHGPYRGAPMMRNGQAAGQRVSPYKLIMFGEKDKFYRKKYQKIDQSTCSQPFYQTSNGITPQHEDPSLCAQIDEDSEHEQSASIKIWKTSKGRTQSNIIKGTKYEFEDGEPLTPNDRSPRHRNLNSDKFHNAAASDAGLVLNLPLASEPSRMLALDHSQREIEPEIEIYQQEPNDSQKCMKYLKYRPKTQRYEQSSDAQFPIITEMDEALEGHHLKQTDETVSERNQVALDRNRPRGSAIRQSDLNHYHGRQSSAESAHQDHHDEVKNYVDSVIEDGVDNGQGDRASALIDVNDSDDEGDPNADDHINLLNKTRNANLPVAVNKAYNISNHFGSTNEIITNGDNDQVLITLNHRNTNSGQQTGRSSAVRRASQPSSKPTSKPLSRKLSHTEVGQAQPPMINQPFESPKEAQKIVFTQPQKLMVVLEPSCIEEFQESHELTHNAESAGPDLVSEPEGQRLHQVKTTEESPPPAVGDHVQTELRLDQLPGRDGDYWDSLCSIPEEYPSQAEHEDATGDKESCEHENQQDDSENPKNEIKVQNQTQPSVFITDSVLTQIQQKQMKQQMMPVNPALNLKYPTPEDRDLMPITKSTTAQKSDDGRYQVGNTRPFKLDNEKQIFQTEAKDMKGKTSPQPRKLQKQTSLKTFHTFDPDGSQKRLQNMSNQSKISGDSNNSNLNLNDLAQNGEINSRQNFLNGGIDDVAAENSIQDQNNNQEDMRVMTQEEYYQMKKEQIEDIYLGTEIIYEEDMENHEFSTLQTCQSATRLILPNQFNNMNFEGNTTQSVSPMKRSSKGMVSPDSRKSWQITNSLEKQANGTRTSQKIEQSGQRESIGNQTAVSRINNLRKKYSVDQQDSKPHLNKAQAHSQKIHRSPPASSQPIVAKQVVLQNPMGPFIPSSNLRQKLPTPQLTPTEHVKPSRIGTAPTQKEASVKIDNLPQTAHMKSKQRSVSPLILVVNPTTQQPSLSSTITQTNPPRSARNTTKTFQHQFKPKAGGTASTSKQRPKQSPHRRPYTSNGVIKHGVNHPRPSIAHEKPQTTQHSPQNGKKIGPNKNFQQYSMNAPDKRNLQHKKLTQHASFLAAVDQRGHLQQKPKGQPDSHKLSWKKFLVHKKSQQHAHSHIQLNVSGKIEHAGPDGANQHSMILEKRSSQKAYLGNHYKIKTGQINLMDSDRSSSKSSDRLGGPSDDNQMDENRRNSIGTRIESYLPEDTLIEPGLSIADNRAEDASQTLDGNLPRTVSYSTHVQSSQKPSQKLSDTVSPRKVSPYGSKIDAAVAKKPLVPKLKLSKVQLHRGVPKPLLTPQSSKNSSNNTMLSLKSVHQKQATMRQLNFHSNYETTEQIKKKIVQQQLSLPHVQQSKKNMMKMGAKERKWAQGHNIRKLDRKKRPTDASLAASTHTQKNEIKVKYTSIGGVGGTFHDSLHNSDGRFKQQTKRFSIPAQHTQEVGRVDYQDSEVEAFEVAVEPGKPNQRKAAEPERETLTEEFKKVSEDNLYSRQDQSNDALFEKTAENRSDDRKLSTAEEFKKNHIVRVTPLQQLKDLGDVNSNALIILSTNSDQRVLSRQSMKSQIEPSFSERSNNISIVKKGVPTNTGSRIVSPTKISEKSGPNSDQSNGPVHLQHICIEDHSSGQNIQFNGHGPRLDAEGGAAEEGAQETEGQR